MGRVTQDLIGQRFGSLVVTKKMPRERMANGKMSPILWYCECDCGGSVIVNSFRLTSGEKKHCADCKGPAKEEHASYALLPYQCPSPCSSCDGQFRYGICCDDCISPTCEARCLNNKRDCIKSHRRKR